MFWVKIIVGVRFVLIHKQAIHAAKINYRNNLRQNIANCVTQYPELHHMIA
jgi:hypothetical protein